MASDADISAGNSSSKSMPPYTSFGSLKSALAVLCEHGVPNRIDRSVWGNKFSGSVVSQVLTAFRFLRLMDPDGNPTPALRDLAKSYNTETWAVVLRRILQASYGQLLELDLQSATANQIYERFRTLYGAEGETGRKCVTFFLHAAQEAAIPVSAYLLSNVKPRGASSAARRKQRVPRISPEALAEAAREGLKNNPLPASPAGALTERLLEKFPEFDPSWPDEIKAKWFSSF
jgi:hypothetical protein